MKNIYKVLGVGLLSIIVFLGAYFSNQKQIVIASVVRGGEYQSTTTVTNYPFNATPRILLRGSGVLGSIIISSTTPGSTSIGRFYVYDATYSTTTATSTIAVFAGNATTGTYTFDANFYGGLVIDGDASFAGSYTITYR